MTIPQEPQMWDATGILKKTFPNRKEPYGFLKLLTPLDKRGMEAAFFYVDVEIPQSERELMQPGISMEFKILKKPEDHMSSPVPFKAIQIKPMNVIQQHGCVVRGPRENGKGIIVSMDYFQSNVHISAASWSELCASEPKFEPLLQGDDVIVDLTWKEIVQAAKEKRSPVGDLVARIPRLSDVARGHNSTRRKRSSSAHLSTVNVERDEAAVSNAATIVTPSAEEFLSKDDNPILLEKPAKRNEDQPKDTVRTETEAGVGQPPQQGSGSNIFVEPVKQPLDCMAHDDAPYTDAVEARQRGRRGHGDAPTERRRTRSCGSSLDRQAMPNPMAFTDDLGRPAHLPAGDEYHPSSHRVSSPLVQELPYINPYFCPAGAVWPVEGGYLPAWVQGGAWSHWSQSAFRGRHSPFAFRMSLSDYFMSGGKL